MEKVKIINLIPIRKLFYGESQKIIDCNSYRKLLYVERLHRFAILIHLL